MELIVVGVVVVAVLGVWAWTRWRRRREEPAEPPWVTTDVINRKIEEAREYERFKRYRRWERRLNREWLVEEAVRLTCTGLGGAVVGASIALLTTSGATSR